MSNCCGRAVKQVYPVEINLQRILLVIAQSGEKDPEGTAVIYQIVDVFQ